MESIRIYSTFAQNKEILPLSICTLLVVLHTSRGPTVHTLVEVLLIFLIHMHTAKELEVSK